MRSKSGVAMKASKVALLSFVGVLFVAAPPAEAASSFRNCATLNATYPNGVGRAGAVDKTKGTPVTAFLKDTKLYQSLPKTLDRDKDGIACEKAT